MVPYKLSTTHEVRSPTDPTEGVANSYSCLNWPIKHILKIVFNLL